MPADIYRADCRERLREERDGSAHMILTDPPYFLDGLDGGWRKGGAPRPTGTVGGMPVGMRFDPAQGRRLQEFMEPVFGQLLRILRPGGFALVFSSPRLYHRMAVAAEDSGFEIRDQLAWHFTGKAQFKAFSLLHFLKRADIGEEERNELWHELAYRKTPQLRPQFESILCAQKPREGTFLDNWRRHGVGLIDSRQSLERPLRSSPSTVMKVEKAPREGHITPKPVELLEHLVRLYTREGQTVVDPFLGSGSTALACALARRYCVGIEINPDYVDLARRRLEERGVSAQVHGRE